MISTRNSDFPHLLVLASASPRRSELLIGAGAGFLVLPSDADEQADPSLSAKELVKLLSARKAEATAALWGDTLPDGILVLAADTVVEAPDGKILGKPASKEDAYAMLSSLSGKRHYVYSGFTLLWKGGVYTEAVASGVCFKPLTDKEIFDYIATGEPMDKAGSYAIQGLGGALTEGYEGDFTNIVGLPMDALEKAVASLFEKSLSDFSAATPPTLIQ